jgi:hypothetical protein
MALTLRDLLNSAGIGGQNAVSEPQRMNQIILVCDLDNDRQIALGLQQFSIPAPFGTSNTVMIQRGITPKKFAGNLTYDAMSCQFKDYVDRPVAQRLLEWRSRVVDPVTGSVNAAASYKRSAKVMFVGPPGTPTRELNVRGIWPTVVNFGDADLSSDETVMIQATFEFDECFPGKGFDSATSFISGLVSAATGAIFNGGPRLGSARVF